MLGQPLTAKGGLIQICRCASIDAGSYSIRIVGYVRVHGAAKLPTFVKMAITEDATLSGYVEILVEFAAYLMSDQCEDATGAVLATFIVSNEGGKRTADR